MTTSIFRYPVWLQVLATCFLLGNALIVDTAMAAAALIEASDFKSAEARNSPLLPWLVPLLLTILIVLLTRRRCVIWYFCHPTVLATARRRKWMGVACVLIGLLMLVIAGFLNLLTTLAIRSIPVSLLIAGVCLILVSCRLPFRLGRATRTNRWVVFRNPAYLEFLKDNAEKQTPAA